MRGVIEILYAKGGFSLADLLGEDPRVLSTVQALAVDEADQIERASRRR